MFLINVSVAMIGLIATFALVPESRAHVRPGLALAGIALSSIGLVALIYGLIEAGQHGWGIVGAVLEIVCGAGVLVHSSSGSAGSAASRAVSRCLIWRCFACRPTPGV